MEKSSIIWMDGDFIDYDKAKIHILCHSLNYGSGVFEGIRFYKTTKGSAIFRLKDHIDRLLYSAKCIGIELLYSKEKIAETIIKLIKVNKILDGYVRPLIFYGYGWIQVNPSKCKPNFAIALLPMKSYLEKSLVKVKISRFIKLHPKSTFVNAKLSGNYVNSILAILDAKKNGYDEALLLDYKGNIAEGSAENFFMIKDGIIYTPALGSILDGITRKSIIQVSKDLGYEVVEKDIKPEEIKDADEAFFTGTAVEIHPIGQIDDSIIGNGSVGKITKELIETFSEILRGNNERYKDWLFMVK